MLSRRHFIGAGAGAVGLFGWFGRLRFRPQRRRLLFSCIPFGIYRTIAYSVDEAGELFVTYGDQPMTRDSGEQAQVFVYRDEEMKLWVRTRAIYNRADDRFEFLGYDIYRLIA